MRRPRPARQTRQTRQAIATARTSAASDQRAVMGVREAARRLGVSYPTVKQWIYKGSVRTVRTAGGHHRVTEGEIDRLLANQSPRATRRRLSRHAPALMAALSGRNQLRGFVEDVRVEGLMAQITLRIGDQWLTAVITRDAVDALRLQRGDSALAIIKSTGVMIAKG